MRNPLFPRCTTLCALMCLAVLLSVSARSSTRAADMPREAAETHGAFDSLVTRNDHEPSAPCAGLAEVRWLPNTSITVSFARDEFTDSEKSAVRAAIDLWQRALARSSLGIVFVNGIDVERDALPAAGQLIVRRDHQMGEGKYGRIVAAARSDRYLDRASIFVNGAIQKKKILRKLMLHEVGHALGLRDCSDCGSGKSVMNHFARKSVFGFSIQDKSVAGKPAAGDVAQVENGYRQAALHLPLLPSDSVESQTIVADEHLIATPAKSNATENILTPYLHGLNLFAGNQLALARVPSSEEQREFESRLPKLLHVEAATMEELKNYNFNREVRIQTIDDDGRVSGEYRRTSDLVLDDAGRRIERNVKVWKTSLRGLEITTEYLEDFSGAQLRGFDLSQPGTYRFEPFSLDTVAGKPARVYRLTPLNLGAAKAGGSRVLYGFVWIDDQTGAILKVAGRALPELKQRYPLFETHREFVDEQHLFPVRTIADDYLVFPSRRVHVRMLITYSNYKRFAGKVNIIELDEP